MDELLTIGKLADHYHVSEDYLKRVLLIRAVAELNALTDRTNPATPEELEVVLTSQNKRLDEVLEGFRTQLVQTDNAVQSATMAVAIVERTTAMLRAQVEAPALKSPV